MIKARVETARFIPANLTSELSQSVRGTFLKLNHEFSNEAPPGRGEVRAETFVFDETVFVARNFSADMHPVDYHLDTGRYRGKEGYLYRMLVCSLIRKNAKREKHKAAPS